MIRRRAQPDKHTDQPVLHAAGPFIPLSTYPCFWFPPAHPHGLAELCSFCTLPVWGPGFTVLSITKSRLIAHQFMCLGGVFLVIVTQLRSPPPDNPAGINISWKFLEFEASLFPILFSNPSCPTDYYER